jgi:hypothetical protein
MRALGSAAMSSNLDTLLTSLHWDDTARRVEIIKKCVCMSHNRKKELIKNALIIE